MTLVEHYRVPQRDRLVVLRLRGQQTKEVSRPSTRLAEPSDALASIDDVCPVPFIATSSVAHPPVRALQHTLT